MGGGEEKKGEEEAGEGVRRTKKEIVPTSLCETKFDTSALISQARLSRSARESGP